MTHAYGGMYIISHRFKQTSGKCTEAIRQTYYTLNKATLGSVSVQFITQLYVNVKSARPFL